MTKKTEKRRGSVRRTATCVLMGLLLSVMLSVPVGATTYIFDPNDKPVYSPDIYTLKYSAQGDDMPCGAFSETTDISI